MFPILRSSGLPVTNSHSISLRGYGLAMRVSHRRGMKAAKTPTDSTNHGKPWKVYPLLQSTTLSSVLDTAKPLISFKAEEKVGSAMKKLAENRIWGGMVFEMRGRPIGFLDVLDVLTDLTHSANVSDTTKTVQEKIDILRSAAPKFTNQTCDELMNASKRDPFIVVPSTKSLYDVVKELCNVHRVAVAETNKWGVFAQSDIAQFLMKRHHVIDTPMYLNVKELGLPVKTTVGSVDEHVTVGGAMRYMRDFKMSGVAVLDKHNRILTNFSASDLLGLTEDKYPWLLLPVFEYLNKKKGHIVPPVTCRAEDTLETVMYKLVYNEVHRIYVVDADRKPVGVITLTDIMNLLAKVTD